MGQYSDALSQLLKGNVRTAIDITLADGATYENLQENTDLATRQWNDLANRNKVTADEATRRIEALNGVAGVSAFSRREFSPLSFALQKTTDDTISTVNSLAKNAVQVGEIVDSRMRFYTIAAIIILAIVALIQFQHKF